MRKGLWRVAGLSVSIPIELWLLGCGSTRRSQPLRGMRKRRGRFEACMGSPFSGESCGLIPRQQCMGEASALARRMYVDKAILLPTYHETTLLVGGLSREKSVVVPVVPGFWHRRDHPFYITASVMDATCGRKAAPARHGPTVRTGAGLFHMVVESGDYAGNARSQFRWRTSAHLPRGASWSGLYLPPKVTKPRSDPRRKIQSQPGSG